MKLTREHATVVFLSFVRDFLILFSVAVPLLLSLLSLVQMGGELTAILTKRMFSIR